MLVEGAARVGVVEHLMAALAGIGIDDLLVTLDGPNRRSWMAIRSSYLRLIDEAGLAEHRLRAGPSASCGL